MVQSASVQARIQDRISFLSRRIGEARSSVGLSDQERQQRIGQLQRQIEDLRGQISSGEFQQEFIQQAQEKETREARRAKTGQRAKETKAPAGSLTERGRTQRQAIAEARAEEAATARVEGRKARPVKVETLSSVLKGSVRAPAQESAIERRMVPGRVTEARQFPTSVRRRAPQPSRLPGSVTEVKESAGSIFSTKFEAKLREELAQQKAQPPEGTISALPTKRGQLLSFGEGPPTEFSPGLVAKLSKEKDIMLQKRQRARKVSPTFRKAELLTSGVIQFGKLTTEIIPSAPRTITKGVVTTTKDFFEGFGELKEFSESQLALPKGERLKLEPAKKFLGAHPKAVFAATTIASFPLAFAGQAALQTTLRGGAFLATKVPGATRLLASGPGRFVTAAAGRGLQVAFVGSEAYSVAASPEPFKRALQVPFELVGFAAGSVIERKILTSATVRRTRFSEPFAHIEREIALGKQFTPAQQKKLRTALEIQTSLRGKKALMPTPRPLTPKELPSFLSAKEKHVILKQLTREEKTFVMGLGKTEKAILFGSLPTQVSFPKGSVRLAEDVDEFVRDVQKIKKQLAGEFRKVSGRRIKTERESIGFGKEKIADIKAKARGESFAFIESTTTIPVKSGKFRGEVAAITQTEQLARKFAGALDPSRTGKKGLKDVKDIFKISAGLAKTAQKKARSVREAAKFGALAKEVKMSDADVEKLFAKLPKQKKTAAPKLFGVEKKFSERVKSLGVEKRAPVIPELLDLKKGEFLHGTSRHGAKSVLKEGLKLDFAKDPGWTEKGIFLTKERGVAKSFGDEVLKVKLTKKQLRRLEIEPAELRTASEAILREDIKPSQISVAGRRPSKRPGKPPSPSQAPSSSLISPTKPSKIPVGVPSRLPSGVPSRIPSRIPSRMPSGVPSGIPSRIPSGIPSRLPSRIPSVLPSRLPRPAPSGVPSRIPSKLPPVVPSVIPLAPSRLPPAGTRPGVVKPIKRKTPPLPDLETGGKKKKKRKVKLARQKRTFAPSLTGVVAKLKAKKAPTRLTGLEARPVISSGKRSKRGGLFGL